RACRKRRCQRPRRRCPDQSPAPQDRGRSRPPAPAADRPRRGLPAHGRAMTTSSATERPAIARKRSSSFGTLMPRGLYTRSLLIVILPIILLQSIVALVFMERHWQATTRRLSTSVA